MPRATYYAYFGDQEKAIQALENFSKTEHIQYWIILFLEEEPLMDSIHQLPEFKNVYKRIRKNFWKEHDELEAKLRDQGLI